LVNPSSKIKFDASIIIEELILVQQAIGNKIFERKHTLTLKQFF
jgi:hypothetical protein